MKSVLCYGDSNTWGAMPVARLGEASRYPAAERWPGVLREKLGDIYRVIEEGLNARTTVFDDPFEGAHKNGKPYLLPCLESHHPLDLVIIMLGSNDLKHRFGLSANDIASGAGTLLDIVLSNPLGPNGTPPQTLLICPAPLARLDVLADMFVGGTEKSQELAKHYRAAAERRGSHFLNAGDHIYSCDGDGIHLDSSQHTRLGEVVAAKVKDIFSAAG